MSAQVDPPRHSSPEQAYLFGLTLHGVKLGLHNIQFLLDKTDNPQSRYPVVHVAGTNGKGSVLALLDAMLRAAGYRTGRFTSPHLERVNERFLIDREPVSDAPLDARIRLLREAAEGLTAPPTFFESCAAIAFGLFADAAVDVALIEVGMGGRLDATNIVRPVATAITNIDLEHTEHLGDTIAKIAAEKAGILKNGAPVVMGALDAEAETVIATRARLIDCPMIRLGRDYDFTVSGDPWSQRFSYSGPGLSIENAPLALPGAHQGQNAAVAVALAEGLWGDFPRLNKATIAEGLATAWWPCRLERVHGDPPVIIDVAHNVAGAKTLAANVTDCVTVLAVSADKDARGIIDALTPVSRQLILTSFGGKRAMPLDELVKAAGAHPHRMAPNLETALSVGLEQAGPDRPLLVTGSIYAAGAARAWLVGRKGAAPIRF